jgi:hypothetical protein
MKLWSVDHRLGASLVKAGTKQAAIRKAERHFGSYAAPYSLSSNQDNAIAWAKAMNARILE